METRQAQLVQSSFSRIFARKADLTSRFYSHLFQQRPDIQPMFKAHFGTQKEMFASMLAMVVRGLTQPEVFGHLIDKLRDQHASLNLVRSDWSLACDCLLLALRDVLQDLTTEEEEAWQAATARLVDAMCPSSKPDPA